jgi:hypothetical protein
MTRPVALSVAFLVAVTIVTSSRASTPSCKESTIEAWIDCPGYNNILDACPGPIQDDNGFWSCLDPILYTKRYQNYFGCTKSNDPPIAYNLGTICIGKSVQKEDGSWVEDKQSCVDKYLCKYESFRDKGKLIHQCKYGDFSTVSVQIRTRAPCVLGP